MCPVTAVISTNPIITLILVVVRAVPRLWDQVTTSILVVWRLHLLTSGRGICRTAWRWVRVVIVVLLGFICRRTAPNGCQT